MGLEEVVKDILDAAKVDSAKIAKERNEKIAEIIKKAEAEVLIKEQRAREDLQRVKDSEERKELSDAALMSKKALQNVKKELIESAYTGLKGKSADIPERERAKILKTLFAKCAKEVSDIGKVYVARKDVRLANDVVRPAKISVLTENIIGGIIAESRDGKFRVDYSFDRFIELIKETRTKELSNILF
ncbi:MAG: V-type ATP synthase subunit E family protein [Nanoarchaeota archaeon]|nr:hypothetical protein [Nanoarchaeota archaeon]MBU4300032.1 hypothetical protein [Nanoarchaeota archaeon]MBU4451833.1 hypothetical protein [Nanoarchaeota archaeon]MCG2724431.1 hypothetical protein [archaeon]